MEDLIDLGVGAVRNERMEKHLLSQADPTDSALAAIASIFERPAVKPPEAPAPAEPAEPVKPVETAESAEPAAPAEPEAPEVAGDASDSATTGQSIAAPPVPEPEPATPPEVDGYSKSGPGPLEQLRFRWTARRGDDGRYYVDETIGTNSLPISSGPMPKHMVIAFIDQRERDAVARFEKLKSQILHGSERGAES